MSSYERDLFNLIDDVKNQVRAMPLYLGGVASADGGGGGPPGGFVGRLPQNRITYDLSELATDATASGYSLLDNLNHIRYRLNTLESGNINIESNDVLLASGVLTLNFRGFVVTDDGNGHVTISGSASAFDGFTVQEDDVEISSTVTVLNFEGAGVTDEGSGKVTITVTPGSGTGAGTFLELTDTPSAYTGMAGKVVVVNGTEDALEFATVSSTTYSGTGIEMPPQKETYLITTSGESHFDTAYTYISNGLDLFYNGVKVLAADYAVDEDYHGFTVTFDTFPDDYIEAVYYTTSGNALDSQVPDTITRMAMFTIKGEISAETGVLRIRNETNTALTIVDAVASVGTPPTGVSTLLDIKKNGVTILTSPLEIGVGEYTSYVASGLVDTTWAIDEYLTMDVTQAGAAQNLSVQVVAEQETTIAQVVNANTLDGKHSVDFALAGHTHALNDLSDMNMAGVTNGQVPKYQASTGKYIPGDATGVGGVVYIKEEDDASYIEVDHFIVPSGSMTEGGDGEVTLAFGASGGADSAAIHDNVAGEIAAITEKTTPVAADKILIEDSEASDAKKYVQVGSLISALSFPLIPVTKTWTSNRADGIFYYLATAGDIRRFSNPALDNILWSAAFYTATQINNQDGTRTAEKATDGGIDGETQCVHTQDTANAWWKADFGSTHKLQPTYIGLIGRTSGGQHPRNFKIQGSDNNTDWTDLLTITAAGPEASSWWSSAISGAAAYRYIRLLQTGVNSSGANYLTFGEIEFWGTLDNA